MFDYDKYLRKQHLPLVWCPGCGDGIIMKAMLRAIDNLNLDQNKVVVVSGIGCASRLPGYVDFNTLHTTHGRALAFATGVKMANPELTVVVVAGDGDATAIGGNHFIHTCRRNIDLTLLVFNNYTYGMTGGQYSPSTPAHDYSSTSPYGNLDPGFDIARLAEAAGATFVARTTSYHVTQMEKLIVKAIEHKGFSVMDITVACHTQYGRKNRFKSPVEMLQWQKDVAVSVAQAKKMSPEELEGKLVTGVLAETQRPEYCEEYQRLMKRLAEAKAA